MANTEMKLTDPRPDANGQDGMRALLRNVIAQQADLDWCASLAGFVRSGCPLARYRLVPQLPYRVCAFLERCLAAFSNNRPDASNHVSGTKSYRLQAGLRHFTTGPAALETAAAEARFYFGYGTANANIGRGHIDFAESIAAKRIFALFQQQFDRAVIARFVGWSGGRD